MIPTKDRLAIRAKYLRATRDKRAFWRQSEIASFLNDLEWVLDELDRLEEKRCRNRDPVEAVGV